jgi:ribonuclease HI
MDQKKDHLAESATNKHLEMSSTPEDLKWYREYRKQVLNIVEDQRGFMNKSCNWNKSKNKNSYRRSK